MGRLNAEPSAAAGLSVDSLRRIATERQRPLELSLKEFAVLEALLSSTG
jgi:DNA-binding response OmpR family regulator